MPRFISKSTGHRIGSANGNSLFKKKSVISEIGRSTHHKNKIALYELLIKFNKSSALLSLALLRKCFAKQKRY